jgi:hypothetical protein
MLLLEFLRADGNLTTNKKLARAIGLQEATLYQELISRYIYFRDKNRLTDDGYFFNCVEDLEYATTLSDKQQRKCINKLKDLNLIFYRVKGIPARRYFKINLNENVIKNVIESYCNSQLSQKGRTWIAERENLEVSKGQCNNTKINNTKEIILKNINVFTSEEGEGNIDFFTSLFSYYIDKHYKITGYYHPLIHIDKVKDIMDIIKNYAVNNCITNIQEWYKIIDRYFDSPMDCDFNMVHFANKEVIHNKAHNLNMVDYVYDEDLY